MTADGRYVAPARWLHWLTAGSILVILVTGFWMVFFEPANEAFKFRLYTLHESFGVLVFVMVLARLWVRWRNPPPPLPEMPGWMKLAAGLNHGALYVLMVVQPVVGFLVTNTWGFPLKWFWLVPLPSPIGRNEVLAPILSQIHWVGALAMVVLLVVHVAAAAQHTFVRRDGILGRMV